ncbi:MAG: hypothetical protein JXA11_02850 [Phycisphaerae bacterium]|nr:hypothetical protein [Phycisphaerae bacterium]
MATNDETSSEMIRLAGDPEVVGTLWGQVNRQWIRGDMEEFFLKPAKEKRLDEKELIRRAQRFVEIADAVAPHWLTEAAAVADAAEVDKDLYTAFLAGVYRKLFLLPECTSYSVPKQYTRDNAILFHKNRDNARRAQCAFVLQSDAPGVNKFISTSDAAALACMMMVNEKGLAGSADMPCGRKAGDAPPTYRGMMNPFILRHIAERADDCDAALAILQDFVTRGYYAGGDVNETHWLFVDRNGVVLEVLNNAKNVESKVHDQKVYFSTRENTPAAGRLREATSPVDFHLFHNVSRDESICFENSISGMTVEIDPHRPDAFTCAWISLPAHSVSFPLLMGGEGTPEALLNGGAYNLAILHPGLQTLWESIETTVHQSKELLVKSLASSKQPAETIDNWTKHQAAMLVNILKTVDGK